VIRAKDRVFGFVLKDRPAGTAPVLVVSVHSRNAGGAIALGRELADPGSAATD
jgi:hypothetical protein